MSRLCFCNKFKDGSPFVAGRDCRICWLYHNDDRYKKISNLVQQAGNFKEALVKRVESNFQNVSPELLEERLKICGGCEFKQDNWQCSQCGCYLTIKAKWATENCPKGKWPLQTIEEPKGDCDCAK